MGEPEFFLMDVGPVRPILTGDEMEEISRKAQVPKDQTPKYNPEHILSPEFSGSTNYESGIQDLVEETKLKLERLLNDPEANPQEIELTKLALKKLDYLFENYNLGMNVFRTAKGGREKLRD
jgi:colicin import membrane protein